MPVAKIHDPRDDKIICFCDWTLVDEQGSVDNFGRYVFVRELWVHREWRGKRLIRKIISSVIEKAPSAVYAYWERRKYGDRIKLFTREELLGHKFKKKEN